MSADKAQGAEPVAWCDPANPLNGEAFAWPGALRGRQHSEPLIRLTDHQAIVKSLQQQAALQAVEIERLKKDAARFKWLSDRFSGGVGGELNTPALLIWLDRTTVIWRDLGRTIDSALSTQQEQK